MEAKLPPMVTMHWTARQTFFIFWHGEVEEIVLPRIGLVVVKAAGLSRRVGRREIHKENILTRDEAC